MTKKTKPENSKTLIAIFSLGVLAFVFIGIGFAILTPKATPSISEEKKAALHLASIEGQFEKTLNDFLGNVSTRVKEYKESRKIMADLIKTDNLRSPDYIAENYAIAREMAPELNQNINAILAEFETADNNIKTLVKDERIEDQNVILIKWAEVKEQQISTYTDYFAFEQELLDRYVRLLEIYNEGRTQAEIIPGQDGDIQLHLKDPRLQKRADIILQDIESLGSAQKSILN